MCVAVTLMLETGMRPEEAYRIRRENVQLVQGFLFIPYGKTKSARRRVPLTASARRVLGQRMASDEVSLPSETDSSRPVPKVNNAHDRAVCDSKVAPFRLYDLRHTWSTRAAMSGIDLVTHASYAGALPNPNSASVRSPDTTAPASGDGAARGVRE